MGSAPTARDARTSFAEAVDDYSLQRVPETETQPGWDIALVRMGFTVSASDLLFGYTIGLYFGFWQAVAVALTYSVIIAAVSILMGFIGLRERTSFALSSRFAFGREGSRLPSLVIALVIAGFYGYILGITVDVFPGLNPTTELLYSVLLGAVFLAIAGLGFTRGLRWVGRVGVPVMILLVLVADVVAVAHAGGIGGIVGAHPRLAGKMALATVIGLGVAKWLGGATVTPDLLRFGRGAGTVVGTTLAEFVVGNFGFNLLGLLLGLGLGASDLGKAFTLIGVSWLALVAFLVQSITVEMNELYAASLAVSNALGVGRLATSAVVGILGIAVGYYGVSHGIIASFLTFIGYIGYALPAVPAIMMADYFVVRRMRYREGFEGLPMVNWRAIVAFVVTVGLNVWLGLVVKDTLWHSLPLIGGALYIVLSIPQMVRSWRLAPSP
ncbi:MAG TPA: cytosine permease [Candidatus Dormibacteraeota bacterium]|nr:cytosine permease [Candidatus Dormibacteraeota bacterium]